MLASAVCRTALAKRDLTSLASLMDRNFDLRLSMFGNAALGEANLEMVSVARSVGGETLSYLYNNSWTALMGQGPAACTKCIYQEHIPAACATYMCHLRIPPACPCW